MDQQSQNYNVSVSDYAQRHYIKSFAKNYKGKWDETLQALIATSERIDNMLRYSRADLLKYGNYTKLVKLDFAVSGRKESPKQAGNRCILFVNEKLRTVEVLLIFAKTDLPKNRGETQFIIQTVKNEFPQLWSKLEGQGEKI